MDAPATITCRAARAPPGASVMAAPEGGSIGPRHLLMIPPATALSILPVIRAMNPPVPTPGRWRPIRGWHAAGGGFGIGVPLVISRQI